MAWIRLAAGSPARVITERTVAEMVASAVPGLEPASVVVRLEVAAPSKPLPRPILVQVGPLSVTASSVPALRAILGGSVALNGLLAALLALLWRRRRIG